VQLGPIHGHPPHGLDRSEYAGWATRQANPEFHKMSSGSESPSPDDAFNTFLRWDAS